MRRPSSRIINSSGNRALAYRAKTINGCFVSNRLTSISRQINSGTRLPDNNSHRQLVRSTPTFLVMGKVGIWHSRK